MWGHSAILLCRSILRTLDQVFKKGFLLCSALPPPGAVCFSQFLTVWENFICFRVPDGREDSIWTQWLTFLPSAGRITELSQSGHHGSWSCLPKGPLSSGCRYSFRVNIVFVRKKKKKKRKICLLSIHVCWWNISSFTLSHPRPGFMTFRHNVKHEQTSCSAGQWHWAHRLICGKSENQAVSAHGPDVFLFGKSHRELTIQYGPSCIVSFCFFTCQQLLFTPPEPIGVLFLITLMLLLFTYWLFVGWALFCFSPWGVTFSILHTNISES